MAIYYFDGANATHVWRAANSADMATGSFAGTVATQTIASTDTVWFRNMYSPGTRRNAGATPTPMMDANGCIVISGLTGVTLMQAPGEPQFELTGSIVTTAAVTPAGTADCFTLNIGAGKNALGGVGHVTYRYGAIDSGVTLTLASGVARSGSLARVALAATVLTTGNSWHYDNTTGLLTVNVTGTGTTMAVGDVAWEIGELLVQWNGIVMSDCTSGLIDGLWASAINRRAANDGNNILGNGTTNNSIIRNCKAWDGGDHLIGFNCLTNTNNSIIACEAFCSGKHSLDSLIYHYPSAGTLTGARITNCFAYVSISLSPTFGGAGTFASPNVKADNGTAYSVVLNGFYAHAPSAGAVVDIELDNCNAVINHNSCLRNSSADGCTSVFYAWYGTDMPPVSGSDEVWENYPFRVKNSQCISGVAIAVGKDGQFNAYRNCKIYLDGLQYAQSSGAAVINSSNGVCGVVTNNITNARLFIEGSDIRINSGNPAFSRCIFKVRGGSGAGATNTNTHVIINDSTLVYYSDDTIQVSRLFNLGGYPADMDGAKAGYAMSCRYRFNRSIFQHATPSATNSAFIGNSNEATNWLLGEIDSAFTIRDCQIYGWTKMSQTAEFSGLVDTQAEWNVATGGTAVRFGAGSSFADPGITAPATSGALTAGGNGATITYRGAPALGLNGRYGTNAGAYKLAGPTGFGTGAGTTPLRNRNQ